MWWFWTVHFVASSTACHQIFSDYWPFFFIIKSCILSIFIRIPYGMFDIVYPRNPSILAVILWWVFGSSFEHVFRLVPIEIANFLIKGHYLVVLFYMIVILCKNKSFFEIRLLFTLLSYWFDVLILYFAFIQSQLGIGNFLESLLGCIVQKSVNQPQIVRYQDFCS